MEAGVPTSGKGTRLCDAQGRPIPVEGTRLVEIRLPTSSGRSILLKERVAISSKVSQPILCFGHLLEQGFGIDGVEQALVHSGGAINIPLQLQNKSMTAMGSGESFAISARTCFSSGDQNRACQCPGGTGEQPHWLVSERLRIYHWPTPQ